MTRAAIHPIDEAGPFASSDQLVGAERLIRLGSRFDAAGARPRATVTNAAPTR